MSGGARAKGGFWYANALRESDLPPIARLLGHALVSVADSETGRVKVSLSWLENATGLSRASVAKYLNTLEADGFLRRRRASRQRQLEGHEATTYTTLIPAGFPLRASPSHGLGVVRESKKASPSHGLSTTSTNPAGAPAAQGASGAAATNGTRPAHRSAIPDPPGNYGDVCMCLPPHKHVEGECIRCGGVIAA